MTKLPGAGKVYLVGAGPGDEGLITLRGVQVLSMADVVLYDGLVNTKILQHAKSNAQILCVGKHGHGGMWTQKEIDDETVRYALTGSRVVRLKGGDTAVFARTAEEIERLVAEGIPFEVVPGITAALAVSAYTGIPLTHRDWASSVALVTGHLQPVDGDVLPEDTLDWKSLASFPGTLVLYMGVTTADVWSQMLVEYGRSSSTPVALVRRVSWLDQQIIRCTLGTVSQALSQAGRFRPPAIAIVGEVAASSVQMDWFVSRPLFGRRYLITSPEPTASKIQAMVNDCGGIAEWEPAMRIVSPGSWEQVDRKIDQLAAFDWVVFSSAHGVNAFMRRLRERGLDARSFGRARIASIGGATAASLDQWGLISDCTPAEPGIEPLTSMLVSECFGKRFLFIRTAVGKQAGMESLSAAGAQVEGVDVYVQEPTETWGGKCMEELANGDYQGVIVTSTNLATNAVRLMGSVARDQSWFCLSPAIAECLIMLGCNKVFVASEASLESLVDRIKEQAGSVLE